MQVVECAKDTCDTCGAEAYVWADIEGHASLAYCAHHGTKYMARLLEQARVVIDLRDTVPQ